MKNLLLLFLYFYDLECPNVLLQIAETYHSSQSASVLASRSIEPCKVLILNNDKNIVIIITEHAIIVTGAIL